MHKIQSILEKPLSKERSLYVGIAQIAFDPQPLFVKQAPCYIFIALFFPLLPRQWTREQKVVCILAAMSIWIKYTILWFVKGYA